MPTKVDPFPQPTQPEIPFLLAADVDGTLLGDDEGKTGLMAFARQYAGSFRLACITGRYCWSVVRLVDEGHLPPPDFICSNVGTEILDCHDPENVIGTRYAARIAPGWDLEAVYTLGEGDGVRRQDFSDGQPPFQAGFDWDGREETLAALRQRLTDHGRYRILPSYGEYIDVLPTGFGKGEAVRFLQQELRIPPARIVVAGDAGNDIEMFETGFQGILPVNALQELKNAACQPWHYHSPYPAARGVLDGLRHFGLVE